MDLKKPENKQELINQIDSLSTNIKNFLTELVIKEDNQKQSALIYYWLRDYVNYLKNEKAFNSKCLIDYPRGSIVSLNLGFNLGSELGGLHYAIVIKDSPRNNPNLIVVPMSSIKPNKKKYVGQIDIGNELFHLISTKAIAIKEKNKDELDFLKTLDGNIEVIEKRRLMLEENLESVNKLANRFKSLKQGSIILCQQITTVSKMRVIDPQKPNDALHGIKVSNEILNEIDKTLIELYTKQS